MLIHDWFTSEDKDVSSVGQLIEEIRPLHGQCVPWFRGHRRWDWAVSAQIWREGQPDAGVHERNLTNRFRTRAATRHQSTPRYDDFSTWLSLMQHYGLPTRLLDWTRSPLIAAYFALESYIYEKSPDLQDAAIWVLNPHRLNDIESKGKETFTPSIEALMCEKMLKPAFTDSAPEPQRVMAVMAAEKDLRMFVQQGAFTIHSDLQALEMRQGRGAYLRRLRIPANSVKAMAEQIDLCGFRKGDIFPDLEHLADELKTRPF